MRSVLNMTEEVLEGMASALARGSYQRDGKPSLPPDEELGRGGALLRSYDYAM